MKLIEIIEYFCKQGISLLPCHGIKEGACTCPRGINCSSPGKHPLFWNWRARTSSDKDVVLSWFEKAKHPINLAISTGCYNKQKKSHLIVVDGDLVNHPFLARLQEHSTTLTQKSGGGGDHAFYWSKEFVRNSCQLVAEKVDIRGYGGIIIIAPSSHKSGNSYQFTCSLNSVVIQDIPDFLKETLKTATLDNKRENKCDNLGLSQDKNKCSVAITTWGDMPVAEIRDKISKGALIPRGVRNVVLHRLLSSDRARGAPTKSALISLGINYLTYFEEPDSLRGEIKAVVNSVIRYPVYNNLFEKINENYLAWLNKRGYKSLYALDYLNAKDEEFFNLLFVSLSQTPRKLSLQEISKERSEFLRSQGVENFAVYKLQLLAKKLQSLGFSKKKTSKCNFWLVESTKQENLPMTTATTMVKTTSENELHMTTAAPEPSIAENQLKDGEIITDPNGQRVRVELIKTQVKNKAHPREHLYMGRTGYDYNKALRALLSRMSDEQIDLLSDSTLVMNQEATTQWLNEAKPGDIIGVKSDRFQVLQNIPGVSIQLGKVNHVKGKPGTYRLVDDEVVNMPIPQIDHARELGLLDILWREENPYGEPEMKDLTVVLLHRIEDEPVPAKSKKTKTKTKTKGKPKSS